MYFTSAMAQGMRLAPRMSYEAHRRLHRTRRLAGGNKTPESPCTSRKSGISLFIVALGLLRILGVLACFIGLFVTIPIAYVAIALAYRDLVGFDPQTQNL